MVAFFLVGFLLAMGAAAGNFVLRFFAGIAAVIGCLGLIAIILALVVFYRLLDNQVSNLALLVASGTWAWWYTVRQRREKREAEAAARVLSYDERLDQLGQAAAHLKLQAAELEDDVRGRSGASVVVEPRVMRRRR